MGLPHKIYSLTWSERFLLLESALMLPTTALGIKVFGVQRWQTLTNSLLKKTHSSIAAAKGIEASIGRREIEMKHALEVARLVRAAAIHGFYGANCLEQSLVLRCLLERSGLESVLRFGARKEDGELQAHAWVECCGIALNEDRGVEERYSPFTPTMGQPLEIQ